MNRLRAIVNSIGNVNRAPDDVSEPAAEGNVVKLTRLDLRIGRLGLSRERVKQLTKFVLIGATGIGINIGALLLLYEWARLPLLVASALAVEMAIVNNYVWNDRWTFRRGVPSLGRFIRFNLVSLGGLAITTGTLYVLARYAGLHYLLANLAGIALATAWNFGLNLIWTWGSGGS